MTQPDRQPPAEFEVIALESRLRKDVEKLATEIGPRSVFLPETLNRARDVLSERFKELGYEVGLESYFIEAGTIQGTDIVIESRTEVSNVVAERKGSLYPDEIFILGAHYDTPGTFVPGANDNGTGVAALLEVARALRENERTVRFIGFVNEEPPFTWQGTMGSVVSIQNSVQKDENIVGMIALDGLGCFQDTGKNPIPNRNIPPINPEAIVMLSYGEGKLLLEKASNAFRETSSVPVKTVFGQSQEDSGGFVWPKVAPHGWSDHFGYLGFKYPAMMITDTGPFRYGAHYHTEGDTTDKVDFKTFTRVAQGIIGVVKDAVLVRNSSMPSIG